jgi:Transglutaminase-like superfamily
MSASLLQKCLSLSPRQWGAVMLSGVYLPVVCVALKVGGLVHALDWLGVSAKVKQALPETLDNPQDALSIGRIVESVAIRMPWAIGCLPLSIAQWLILDKLAVCSDLMIGVSSQESTLIAHAWVQVGEVSLGSPIHHGQYARIWSCRHDGVRFQMD